MKEPERLPDHETALTVPPNPSGLVAEWGFGELSSRYFSTLDESTRKGKLQALAIMGKRGENCNDWINKPIIIVGLVLQPTAFSDEETGEEVKTIVTKLVTSDGKLLETHSKGIAKSVVMAMSKIGLPSDKMPWKATIVTQQLRANKKWLILDFS